MIEKVLRYSKGKDYITVCEKHVEDLEDWYIVVNRINILEIAGLDLDFEFEKEKKEFNDQVLIETIKSLKEDYEYYMTYNHKDIPKDIWEYVEYLEEFFEKGKIE